MKIYHKVKDKLDLDKKNIQSLSLEELTDIALKWKEKEEEIGTKSEVLVKKYKLKDVLNYDVYMFENYTEEDFKFYQLVSTNTEWCTRPNYNTFKKYIVASPLIVFIDKTNRDIKFQYHMKSGQFMDKYNYKLEPNIVSKILGELLSRIEIKGRDDLLGDSIFLRVKVIPGQKKKKKKILGIPYNVTKYYRSIIYEFNDKKFSILLNGDDIYEVEMENLLYRNDSELIKKITNLLK